MDAGASLVKETTNSHNIPIWKKIALSLQNIHVPISALLFPIMLLLDSGVTIMVKKMLKNCMLCCTYCVVM